MDIRVIRDGRNGKTNWTNFTTYNMQHPLALIRCDNHAPPFRKGEPDILIFIYNTSMYTLVGNCRTSCYNWPSCYRALILSLYLSDLHCIFNAIICDPPYGIRAGGRKSGGRKILSGKVEPYVIEEKYRVSCACNDVLPCWEEPTRVALHFAIRDMRLIKQDAVLRLWCACHRLVCRRITFHQQRHILLENALLICWI